MFLGKLSIFNICCLLQAHSCQQPILLSVPKYCVKVECLGGWGLGEGTIM